MATAPKKEIPPTIEKTGEKVILPIGMTFAKLRDWADRMMKEEETEIGVMEVIAAPCLDAAVAFVRALADLFGWVQSVPTPGFFGSRPPLMISVPSGPNGETIQVPWGRIQIPNMAGFLTTGTHITHDGEWQFQIGGQTLKKHQDLVTQIATRTRELLAEQSIYRGQALRLNFSIDPEDVIDPIDAAPKFLPLGNVTRTDLVLPKAANDLVETALFAPIMHTNACRAAGIPLKRGILLEGPFGVGKTLTSLVTAQIAKQNGWTFLYLESVEHLDKAIRFAKRYQPAVIFTEDIDRAGNDRNDVVNGIMNTLDGLDSKGTEIITVVTTNHVEAIPQGLMRPGRFDAVIPVRPPDAIAAARLVRLFGANMIDPSEDLTDVGLKLAGSIPAVIREVVERSKLAAILRDPDSAYERGICVVKASDLMIASEGMIEHLKLLEIRRPDARTNAEKAAQILADAIDPPRYRRGENHAGREV